MKPEYLDEARKIFLKAISLPDGHGCVWECGEQEKLESAIAQSLSRTASEARAATIEECAKEAERYSGRGSRQIATAIRVKLKDEQK